MQFQRLRISGFKSFVEPTEVRIEPGLTGIVGPNGCGKSNLLEALRWVMGATSAKAMRAGGMDDVIFAGSGGGAGARPARNHAEVRLEIDNSDRRAPAPFNGEAVIEVTRRIDRGAGSTYRVNGVETRARDVQLLFADASTGANSPSLVRQGQIAELIAAKPSNRRRILEEAAGVSGLHTRRHEADLRLSAAESNLARLDDVARELESGLGKLKREARRAEAYRRLAAEIRRVQAGALHARWAEAAAGLDSAESAAREAQRRAGETAAEAARAVASALTAGEGFGPLREEETVAAAVLQRLAIERDRAERDEAHAREELSRLQGEARRVQADLAREHQLAEEAAAAEARLARDLAEVEAAIASAPEREPERRAALQAAERARADADADVERLAAEAAASAARRQAGRDRLAAAEGRRRTAAAGVEAARARLARTTGALDTARAEAASLSAEESPQAAQDRARLVEAEAALAAAREALAGVEQALATAQAAEERAREAARAREDETRRLKTEAQGLAQLARPTEPRGGARAHPPALDQVRPAAGYEAAVAAAFGDDLEAALDPAAPAHWRAPEGEPVRPPEWPRGAEPLSDQVDAPPELAARLALTALVAREDGARLSRLIPTGARLVSREGDLWRWDGFVSRAEAPRPAARRMAQRARLAEVEAELARLAPEAQAASAAHQAALGVVRAAQTRLTPARAALPAAERSLAQARAAVERHAQEAARRSARAAALAETAQRLETEAEDARSALAAAEAELAEAQGALELARVEVETGDADAEQAAAQAIAAARARAASARQAEAQARSELDAERRAREGRTRRREQLGREQVDWLKRAGAAGARVEALEREAGKLATAMAAAAEAPAATSQRRARLLDEVGAAEARRARAADALAAAEAALAAADRAARAAEAAAADARTHEAGALARLDAAREKLEQAAAEVRRIANVEPDALAAQIAREAVALPSDPAALESHLVALERERDSLGPVNLRADEEAAEHHDRLDALRHERADLVEAVKKLRDGIEALNAEGRERLLAAFAEIDENFRGLFSALFEGGQAELRLVESDDALEAGLEIYACPPGKRLSTMSLMSGGEQALTACALIFAVFLSNPSPVCVLDEVDAPLDDANVDRFCRLLDEMRRRTATRFLAITHNPVTMSRMDRLLGVTMAERGVSQLVSVDLARAEALAAS